jgi:cytochrome P450
VAGSAGLGVPALETAPPGPAGEALDFASDGFQTEPWPVYRELRRTDPVHWMPDSRAFLLLRHADVLAALTDERLATDFPVRASRRIFGGTLLDADGEGHRRLRQGFGALFGPTAVAGRGARMIAEAVSAVLEPLADSPGVDFAARIAAVLPYEVTTRLLGLAPQDGPWLRERIGALAKALDFPGGPLAEARRAEQELGGYLRAAALRQDGAGAEPTLLELLRHQGLHPDAPEFAGTAVLFLLAGTETSEAALSTLMLALLAHRGPEAVADWTDRAAVAAGVRETLRWEPPTHSILRYALADLVIRGVRIPRHSAVLLSLASANRDEEVFEQPDRWWPDRPRRRSLTFGAGPHTCLGIHLAHAEFEALVPALARRFDDIALDGAPPPLRGHGFRRPVRLDLSWRPRTRGGPGS